MWKKYLYYFGITIFIAILGAGIFCIRFLKRESSINSGPIIGVEKFGKLKLGGKTISGEGEHTFAPYIKIPHSKFYVTIVQEDTRCINKMCNLDGAFIQTMGGWLQMDNTRNDPETKNDAGFNLPENKNVKSIVLIGDHNGKIAGIYPNRGLKDVIPILKLHPDLADFSLLDGADEFGSFKIGEFAPLKPGDPITYLSDKLAEFAPNIPKDKKFYLYSIEKRKYDTVGMYEPTDNEYVCFISGCRYPNPDPPHDFLYAEIDELGGGFLANDMENSEMVELFEFTQDEVLDGKSVDLGGRRII